MVELTRIAEIGNKNWKVKASKLIYIKRQIWGLAKLWECEISNGQKIQKFANFWSHILVLKIWNTFYKFVNFPILSVKNFPNFTISKINQIPEIIRFRKLANFLNLTICKTIKIPKNSNFVNYHICVFWMFNLNKREDKKQIFK